jgi:hypothetical protein
MTFITILQGRVHAHPKPILTNQNADIPDPRPSYEHPTSDIPALHVSLTPQTAIRQSVHSLATCATPNPDELLVRTSTKPPARMTSTARRVAL